MSSLPKGAARPRGKGMSSVVLDASALLAVTFAEEGCDLVLPRLPGALLSAVNLAEVLTRAVDRGMPLEAAESEIKDLPVRVIPFVAEQASLAAGLRPATAAFGLSLGDRACLALAKARGACVLTADRRWRDVAVGVEVLLIR
jgi:ribonuclease VapC